MAFRDQYRRQVALLMRVLPFLAEDEAFALKGGTAINLFIRDMPRLSVDIDLTYVPVVPRPESLAHIDQAMRALAESLRRGIPSAHVTETPLPDDGAVTRLIVRAEGVQVKVEVTPVLRGCLYEPERRTVTPAVEDAFGFAEARVLPFADLYAGKIVAALDRQHPRDLFDIRTLLADEGIDAALRTAFIVYLISHNRPMHEILAPTLQDIEPEYESGFAGMTADTVPIEELLEARDALLRSVVGDMPTEHRRFLLSFKRGEPDWALVGLEQAADLPAVRWRQRNLDKLGPKKRAALVDKLAAVIGET